MWTARNSHVGLPHAATLLKAGVLVPVVTLPTHTQSLSVIIKFASAVWWVHISKGKKENAPDFVSQDPAEVRFVLDVCKLADHCFLLLPAIFV